MRTSCACWTDMITALVMISDAQPLLTGRSRPTPVIRDRPLAGRLIINAGVRRRAVRVSAWPNCWVGRRVKQYITRVGKLNATW
jgi:hypothetical protein